MSESSDFRTFGPYAEIPVDQITPALEEGGAR